MMLKKWFYSSQVVLDSSSQPQFCCFSIDGNLINEVRVFSNKTGYNKFIASLPQNELTNLEKYIVTPAFINAHTHLAMNFFRGIAKEKNPPKNMVTDFFFKYESKLSYNDVLAFSKLGAYESLLHGVGLVWDHYYFGEAVAQALSEVGLCGVVAPTIQDLSGPGKETFEKAILATENLNSLQWKSKGIYSSFGPHATDSVSKNLLQQITNMAKKANLPIHMHTAQNYEELCYIKTKHKKSIFEYLDSCGFNDSDLKILAVHGIFLTNRDFQLLKKNLSHIYLCICPYSQMIFAFPADLRKWIQHQLKWVVATDCAASNDSLNLAKELRWVANLDTQIISLGYQKASFKQKNSLRKKLQPSFASLKDGNFLLSKIWETPGQLHPTFKAGKIAPGYLANFCAWDPTHPSLWPFSSLRSLYFNDASLALCGMWSNGSQLGTLGANFSASILESLEYKNSVLEAQKRLDDLLMV